METTPIKLTPANLNENTPNSVQSSSSRSSAAKPMSSSLKEKLKRSRHSFRSPLGVVKRLKIEDDGQPGDDTDVNRNNVREQRDRSHHTAEPAQKDPARQCEELRKAVKEKSETLRRLKMAKMYRKKNDLTQLQRLVDKWRSCAQSVLCELQSELPSEGKQVPLSQLIDSLGLDDKILHFDRTEEDFTDN
ncbi:swi5-dependent recombination DNA repair protein 1 homolog [Puntigrus tetrazona]|uniref:swi5-dependent recombination DNA repair protein 1 homolog n=1 Tax=Puntigrus tetrazona TaxID=1606681 RepID=UPI001C8AE1F7|nr:swi5-dependent recombination DNA repair protein 1 homolog [Puntigrus tetrazona]